MENRVNWRVESQIVAWIISQEKAQADIAQINQSILTYRTREEVIREHLDHIEKDIHPS
jgi:hypothetical protein